MSTTVTPLKVVQFLEVQVGQAIISDTDARVSQWISQSEADALVMEPRLTGADLDAVVLLLALIQGNKALNNKTGADIDLQKINQLLKYIQIRYNTARDTSTAYKDYSATDYDCFVTELDTTMFFNEQGEIS